MGFPGGAVVKKEPASAGDARDLGSIPGWSRSPEEEMATHSNIIAWKITRTEEPGGVQSMGSQRVGQDWAHIQEDTIIIISSSYSKWMTTDTLLFPRRKSNTFPSLWKQTLLKGGKGKIMR